MTIADDCGALGDTDGAGVRASLLRERGQSRGYDGQGGRNLRRHSVSNHASREIPIYEEIRRRDAPFYARLAKSGFEIDFGEDESGLMMKALRTVSGYYIDVGASDLIARGDIAIGSGVEICCVRERSVELTDGSELLADLIVMATGFQSMNRALAPIISEGVADKVGKCWGLGSGVRGDPRPWEGEPRNMWKPTQQPGLWFPRRQSRAVAALLSGSCASDQGTHGGAADTSLWFAAGPSPKLMPAAQPMRALLSEEPG